MEIGKNIIGYECEWVAAVNWLGGIALAAEFLGIGIDFLENQVMRWNHNSNPFIFLIDIARGEGRKGLIVR